MANVYVRSGAAGANDGSSWANAYTTIQAALAAKAAGDTFGVADDHNASTAGTSAMTSPGTISNPCKIVCVDHTVNAPWSSADLRTGAVEATTGSNAMSFNGYAESVGVEYRSGTSGTTNMNFYTSAHSFWRIVNGKLVIGGTGGNFTIGNSSVGQQSGRVEWDNTTIKFANAAQSINVRCGELLWTNTPSAIDTGGTIPNNLFTPANFMGIAKVEGVDLSALTTGKQLVVNGLAVCAKITFKDCKLDANVTVMGGAAPTEVGGEVILLNCDSGATNTRNEKHNSEAILTTHTTLIRTPGANNGSSGYSHKVVTFANASWMRPFRGLVCAAPNRRTGANRSVTLCGILSATAVPNNDEFWFDLEYSGSASTPLGSFKTGTKADTLASGSALTADTSAWDSQLTARANSTTYAVGDIRKVASNSGRAFIVTAQTGASAGSEPAGFASAADGDAITDGNVTWRCMVRFKLTVTLSSPQPQLAGPLYVYPKIGKASTTYWYDPRPELS